jgi:hypothetical protein
MFGFYDDVEFPAAEKLMLELRDKINYSISASSLYKILKSFGPKCRKTNGGHKFLMETGEIMAA